jgi:hypothetical protein
MHTCFATPVEEMPLFADTGHTRSKRGSDPWAQTLQLLDMLRANTQHLPQRGACEKPHNVAPLDAHPAAKPRARRCAQAEAGAMVTLIERLTSTSVVLRWCSPSCHYGDQIWTCCVARTRGRCAVTGHIIERGDAVYRPQNRKRMPPVNADAMIHPSALV